MAFPSIVYNDYGAEKIAQSTRINDLPLGSRMVLPDGREFQHCRAASGTALVAGSVYGQPSLVNAIFRTGATIGAVAIGDTTITVTISGTILAVNEFKDGYLYVASTVGTGGGIVYKIKSHPAAASTETCVVTLADNDAVKVAMAAGTTTIGMRRAISDEVIIVPAGTADNGALAGVAPVAVTAGYYCWLQKKGPAAVLTDATVIIGEPVVCSSAIAGAVAPFISSTTAVWKNQRPIGECMQVAASTGFSLINLNIP